MKRPILFAFIALFSANVSAQKIGVQIGGNLASTSIEERFSGGSLKPDTESKIGFLIGALAEIPFSSLISLRPELNFIQKGYKFEEGSPGDDRYTENVTLNYIELPLNFIYNAPVGTGTFFVGAGPNFSFGLSGKQKTTETGDLDETIDVKFDGKENATATDDKLHLKGFDFGGNLLAGYKMSNGLSLNIGYTLGVSNISPDKDATYKNSGGLTLKLGYTFSGAGSGE